MCGFNLACIQLTTKLRSRVLFLQRKWAFYHTDLFPTLSKSDVVLFSLQCLTPDVALSVLEDDGKSYLTEEDYQRISTVLLYYIINLQDLCVSSPASSSSLSSSSSSSGNYQFYLLALTNLHPAEDNQVLSLSETESILQLINQHYNPSNQETSSDLQVRDFLVGNLSCISRCKPRFNHLISDPTVY